MKEKSEFEKEYLSIYKLLEDENKKDVIESKMSRTQKPESNTFGDPKVIYFIINNIDLYN